MKKIKISIILIIILGIILFINKDYLLDLDYFIVDYVALNLREPFLTDLMKFFSLLGSAYFFIPLAIILLIFYKNKNKYYIIFTLISVFLTNQLIKLLVGRDRPVNPLVEASQNSFPSGHAMVSTAVYGMIIYLVLRSNLKKANKIVYTIFFTVLITLISFSRIYLNVHYFSDVYTGIFAGILFLLFFILIEKKSLKNN